MDINYPFRINKQGRTAEVEKEKHIRQLVEQVLFTAVGERVNRPTFGSGINQLLFAPNSEELATATQFLVRGALQQWLGNIIHVKSVEIDSRDSRLSVTVQYVIRRNQQQQVAKFTQEIK